MIIRNGVRHNISNFGGSGNANIVKLTQSEYDALPESKKSDGILYAITDGECSASGGSSKPVELTKAEYEALGDKVNSDGILYAITDGDGLSAKSMDFDDTETQLGVNNVQDAIVEQNKKFEGLIIKQHKNTETITVPAKEAIAVPTLNVSKDGYTPIGIVGVASISGCALFNYELNGNELRSYIYNTMDTDRTDYIRFTVLYVKNI